MNYASFQHQINLTEKVLVNFNLINRKIYMPQEPVNPSYRYKNMPYTEVWADVYKNRFFNFELKDSSLLHFRYDSYSPIAGSFSYFGYPFRPIISYEDFIYEYFENDLSLIGDEFYPLYEDYILTNQTNWDYVYIRYDYDETNYTAGRHPASHIHIGYDNEIRIGSKKILKPLSFTYFIIRQLFPETWSNLLSFCDDNNEDMLILKRNVRDSLDDLHTNFWNPRDLHEMYLY